MFHLFFAGTEVPRFYTTGLECGMNSQLISYYYLQTGKKSESVKNRKLKTPQVEILVDSGANTLMKKNESMTKKEAKRYLRKYVEWLEEYGKYCFAAVEMDLDVFFGFKTIRRWREKYFKPLEEKGLLILYVYRQDTMSKEDFIDMCKEYRYVALSGSTKEIPAPHMNGLFSVAEQHGTRLHGLGLTVWEKMLKHPWYSVDSTTPKMCEVFGETHLFVGNKLVKLRFTDKQQRRRYRKEIESLGLDWEKIERDEAPEILRWNLKTWKKITDHINHMRGRKDYHVPFDTLPKPDTVDSMSKVQMEEWAGKILLDPTIENENDEKEVRVSLKDALVLCHRDPVEMPKLAEKETLRDIAEGTIGESSGDPEILALEVGRFYRRHYMEKEGLVSREEAKQREELSPLEEVKETAIELKKGAPLGNQNARKHGLYSKLLPGLTCNSCPIRDTCPKFKVDHVCAFQKEFEQANVETVADAIEYMKGLVQFTHERMIKNALFEAVQGGIIDPQVSLEQERLFEQTERLARLQMDGSRGGEELTVRGGPGILERLFGKTGESREEPGEIKEAQIIEKEAEEKEVLDEGLQEQDQQKRLEGKKDTVLDVQGGVESGESVQIPGRSADRKD